MRLPKFSALFSWALFDWANSAFPTVVVTFVFSAYFTQSVADEPTRGTAQWGQALALAGLCIALLSPLLGAIADAGGRRKPWLFFFTVLCVLASGFLWFVRPEPGDSFLALLFLFLGVVGFEFGNVFYNAMLADLVPRNYIGRVSGWGWGLGYAGGLFCLGLVLAMVSGVLPLDFLGDIPAASVRLSGPLVALWLFLFALPLFIFTPDRPSSRIGACAAAREGAQTLLATLRNIGGYRDVARFLVAHLFYREGLNTLFAFGGIYAAGTFAMSVEEILLFGIAMNLTAGIGAAGFAWLDDALGAKRTILMALLGLLVFGLGLLVVSEKVWFWALAVPLGFFVGPAQAASRSFMARLAPSALRAEMFGLFAFSGKAAAFLGPALLAWVTLAFDSQRAGMAVAFVFLAIGFLLLLFVPDPDGGPDGGKGSRSGSRA